MADEPVAPSKPELPRRRSTVREPAPFPVGNAAAASQPAPAIAAPGGEVETTTPPLPVQPPDATPDPATPRRAGWWAKRMLGDKG
jgi:ribonuclease E